ncbi:MAG: dihydrodipicolinate synthase family protein [Cephaloticoccus sp.]|nr:dihydrodipicolinate synthase family protein [Cephaloticoccus sp.]MCF7759379.1 dihydrodipicolinate synthase family protein [Cephaloticoccus sp.]
MAPKIKPLTRNTLRGVWSALILPWTERDTLDAKRFAQEIRGYAGTGVSGVYTGGTTGEFYAQDDATYEQVTEIVCREAHAMGLPVQIGVSALSTRTVKQRIRVAKKYRADAIQVALPFWLELKDDEVKRFVHEVAAAAGKTPIILYLTGRSKRKVSPALMGQLAREVPTFIGTKDTGLDAKGIKAILRQAPDIAIFGGEDFYVKLPAGGKGGYCSITGFNAPKIVELYNLCAAGKFKEAQPLADSVHRFLHGALVPMVTKQGLWDSAIDRIQRMAGGGVVGLRCQSPYRSGTDKDLKRVIAWCRQHTPELLPAHLVR